MDSSLYVDAANLHFSYRMPLLSAAAASELVSLCGVLRFGA
jgi:hypothetical protein